MVPILEIVTLRKTFGRLTAVDDVSFTLRKGELLGLLGPNGAGKPLEGDTDPGKRRIGLVPQDLALYDELSARENLRFFGALYDIHGRVLDEAIMKSLELV